MGAFLDKPLIEKRTISGTGRGFSYAVASMQGWRIEMEDAHQVQVSMAHPKYPQLASWTFLAVFDGHAGSKVALHSAEKLLDTLLATKEFEKVLADVDDAGIVSIRVDTEEHIRTWLKEGFLELDASMRPTTESDRERSGTTAVCAILTPTHIFFANLGDSRGLLSKREQEEPFATVDHKPYLDAERERIVKAGGSVMIQRVNGSLAVSRALGDFEYKAVSSLQANEQLVSPEPDVDIRERDKDADEFLVLACDGIFDVFENKQLCQAIRAKLKTTRDLETLANQLLDASISKGSRDNMTMVLVVFEPAPELCPEDIAKEEQFDKLIKEKIEEIIAKAEEALDPDRVTMQLTQIAQQDPLLVANCLLPISEGVHMARPFVHELIEQHQQKAADDKKATTAKREQILQLVAGSRSGAQPPQADSVSDATTRAVDGSSDGGDAGATDDCGERMDADR